MLLHGVALGGWAMRPLARALEKAGYRTVNVTYPSRTMALEEIAGGFLPAVLSEHGVAGGQDGAVTVVSARLEGMRDWIVLPHSHTMTLWRGAVIAQVLHFRRKGSLRHLAPPGG